jgi:hypothetical protein
MYLIRITFLLCTQRQGSWLVLHPLQKLWRVYNSDRCESFLWSILSGIGVFVLFIFWASLVTVSVDLAAVWNWITRWPKAISLVQVSVRVSGPVVLFGGKNEFESQDCIFCISPCFKCLVSFKDFSLQSHQLQAITILQSFEGIVDWWRLLVDWDHERSLQWIL